MHGSRHFVNGREATLHSRRSTNGKVLAHSIILASLLSTLAVFPRLWADIICIESKKYSLLHARRKKR